MLCKRMLCRYYICLYSGEGELKFKRMCSFDIKSIISPWKAFATYLLFEYV